MADVENLSHDELIRVKSLDRAINATYDERDYKSEEVVKKAAAFEKFIKEGNNG